MTQESTALTVIRMKLVPVKDIPKKCSELDTCADSIQSYVRQFEEMAELCTSHNGIGLAAPQVGLPYNMFVIRRPDGRYDYMMNCYYEPTDRSDHMVESVEGCLSILGPDGKPASYRCKRHEKIRVRGYEILKKSKPEYNRVDVAKSGYYSLVYQHEIDHCKGILISDIGKLVKDTKNAQ